MNTTITYREAVCQAIREAMERDKRVFFTGEASGATADYFLQWIKS